MGTSNKIITACTKQEDHPHAYGDKQLASGKAKLTDGSSPRVWGQVKKASTGAERARIIPTRMGTRVFANANFLTCEDHPHAYGDKLL